MIKKLLFTFFLFTNLFLTSTVFGQTAGDYQSNGSGNWITLSSWQRWNGTAWETPTAGQGYPGQYSGTGEVTIRNGNTISLVGNGTTTSFQTLPMGTITITGKLYLDGITSSSSTMEFDTQLIYVTPNVGIIEFNNKVSMWVVSSLYPGTSALVVNKSAGPPAYQSIIGDCSHNQDIYFGPGYTSYCAASPTTNFDALMNAGGSLNASIAPVLNICAGSTINLSGSITGPAGTGLTYNWYLNGSTTAFATGTTASISSTVAGTYTIKLTCSTVYGTSTSYSNSETITVTVNPLPIITTQPVNQLDCEGSIVSFKAVASGTGLSYVWLRKRPEDASFDTIPVEANVSYPSPGEIRLQNVGGSLSPNGTQYQVVISNGTCNVISSVATLSVNEITNITSPSLTPSQSVVDVTLCYGTTYSYTVSTSYPSNVVSYQWKSSVIPGTWNDVVDGPGTHFSGAQSATLSINNGTPAESAEYRVYITFLRTGGNCNVSSDSRTRKLTFLPLLLTPAVSIIQPTCTTSTGTINVTVQSSTDVYSFDNGSNYQASNVKSGLTAGDYNIIIKNSANCLSPVTNASIIAIETNTYNGTSWSLGTPPATGGTQNLVFDSNFTANDDLSSCSCTVNSGKDVTISSGKTLTITNAVDVQGSGTLTFEEDASLVQTNEMDSNSGEITYKRSNTSAIETDYTYWSSPVVGQTLEDVSPNTPPDYLYSFDSASDSWVHEGYSTVMGFGLGYIIRGPHYPVPVPGYYESQFFGKPNNGAKSINGIVADRSYLLGNPYPSAIDTDAFLIANNGVLDGTLYFWTHNTAIQDRNLILSTAGTGALAYTSDDYAVYNFTGGVAAGPLDIDTITNTTYPSSTIPLGKIAAGQGFFASSQLVPSSSIIVFNNSMRVAGNNTQFFKQSNKTKSRTANSIVKNRIWLNLTNTEGLFKQTLVGYVTGASNGIDNAYDGESLDANQYADFYSIQGDKNLTIQGRALPFEDSDEVSLGYRSAIAGQLSIKIDQTDGVLASQDVFIEDKLTNSIHNLKQSAYQFTTAVGTFDDRFVLRYTNAGSTAKTLKTNDFKTADNSILVSNKNKQLQVNSGSDNIDKIMIYDLLGRQIYKKINVDSNAFSISNLNATQQTLVVKVILQSGQIVSKKVIY